MASIIAVSAQGPCCPLLQGMGKRARNGGPMGPRNLEEVLSWLPDAVKQVIGDASPCCGVARQAAATIAEQGVVLTSSFSGVDSLTRHSALYLTFCIPTEGPPYYAFHSAFCILLGILHYTGHSAFYWAFCIIPIDARCKHPDRCQQSKHKAARIQASRRPGDRMQSAGRKHNVAFSNLEHQGGHLRGQRAAGVAGHGR